MNTGESQNISKPSYFDGNNYSHWKAKMTIFIQSLDYNLWDLIVDDIKSMFSRLTNIINALQALNKTYSNSEMVRTILRCLPKSWMPKVTAIEKAKNLKILPLEDLLGSLMTHELSMQKKDDDEEKEKKKKTVVDLKSSTFEDSDDDDDDNDDDDDDNKDLALITRKLKKILANKRKFGGKPNKKFHQKGEPSKREEIIFFSATSWGTTRAIVPN
ncbi:DUF4219 domain-containing protein/UBN2 domain-containing protein [Cephalotus follicularis]|uniref:DUF4219 domain-containing protein/UBN2 domain-containing protein n=1 Tax=Cephalotus follicularis TaxID=3775 RepID=A0A1Q3AQW4_CEPFO|nr:DUF4219 domain-containing protein/UBN2 domain-containing protein [Cephalotus follicularis]